MTLYAVVVTVTELITVAGELQKGKQVILGHTITDYITASNFVESLPFFDPTELTQEE